MSNLYIRVKTGFYSHRKTIRLRSVVGDDAFWIVPRLWAYAAENQPDGNMSGYSSEELSLLLGCSKHATSILEALKTSGYLDVDGMIHDWQEHNGYHQKYSERAKVAAKARWDKSSKTGKRKRKEESGDKHCLEHACSIYDAFPKKVGRPAALKAIQKALKTHSFEYLFEKTKLFAVSREGQDPQYTPHPATWFNQERYNDEIITESAPSVYTPNLG